METTLPNPESALDNPSTGKPEEAQATNTPSSPPPANRFAKGHDTDWLDLVDHKTSLPADMPMEQVQDYFRNHPEFSFGVVLDEHQQIVGLCSEQKIGNTLSQWGLGYAVFARKPVRNHILERDLRVIRGTPVHKVLNAIMRREEGFFDDVILVDRDGSYLGLIRVATLVHLQHEINRQQYEEIKGISDQLNRNNEELAKARDIAMQAAQMKSAFLANMSHEIRTPMNGILGMIKILMRTPLNDQQRRYAQTVQNSGNALLTILNDILDFSKIEAGKMEFEDIDFNLVDLIEESVQLMNEKAREKGLELFSWINADAKTLLVSDPSRLRQVILNLTSNAIKFTEKGEVMLRVTQVEETDDTATLRISVSDTGIGISEENQKKLFEAFQQADSATNRKFGGTGLGLAISRRIVELLGGEMGLESELGKGSTFWMKIPFKKQQTVETDENSSGPVHADFWGVRALIVGESATYGDYIRQLMHPWNIISRHVENLDEAFDLAASQGERGTPMDLILIDARMTGRSGFELAERLHQDSRTARSRVLIMASDPTDFDRSRARDLGITECLHKPIKPSELKESISRILQSTPDNTPHPETSASPEPAQPTPVALPTAEGAEAPSASEITPTDQLVPPSRTRSLKLLLVEDSEVNREVALIQLQAWNHRVTTATNGREAVDVLSREEFDGVLMDCQMPELDGYGATREIRNPDSPVQQHGIHIIAMTANALQGDREKCLEAGMDDYVSKPVDEEELIAALEKCAAKSMPDVTATATGSDTPPAPPSPPISGVATLSEQKTEDPRNGFPPHLIEMFLNETDKRLGELDAAIRQNQWEQARHAAHTIKGTAGNFKASALAEFARECEAAASRSEAESARECIVKMREAFSEHRQLLETHSH